MGCDAAPISKEMHNNPSKVRNCWPNDIASHPTRLQSSVCIILKCICLKVPILSDTLWLFPPKFETWKLKQMSETHSCLTAVPTVQLSDPPRLLTATLSIPWSSWHSMAKKSPTVLLIGRRVNLQRSRRDGSGTVTWGRPLKYSTDTSVRTRIGLHLFTES